MKGISASTQATHVCLTLLQLLSRKKKKVICLSTSPALSPVWPWIELMSRGDSHSARWQNCEFQPVHGPLYSKYTIPSMLWILIICCFPPHFGALTSSRAWCSAEPRRNQRQPCSAAAQSRNSWRAAFWMLILLDRKRKINNYWWVHLRITATMNRAFTATEKPLTMATSTKCTVSSERLILLELADDDSGPDCSHYYHLVGGPVRRTHQWTCNHQQRGDLKRSTHREQRRN